MDEGGRPDIVAKPFIVISRSWHSYNILLRTAIVVFIDYPPLRIYGDAFTLVFYIIYHPALFILHFLDAVGLAVSFVG